MFAWWIEARLHMQCGRRAPWRHLSCYVLWHRRATGNVCFPSGRKAPRHFLNGRMAPLMEAKLQNTSDEESSNVCGHNATRTMQSIYKFAHAYIVSCACDNTLHCCFGQYACDQPVSLLRRLILQMSSYIVTCTSFDK